ncbi:NAD(+) synthase [Patescibacteria group bacterium]|nr:NAD(+) synthase [Patescibacteria group bacterium]
MKILTTKQCKKFLDLATDKTAQYLKKNSLRGISLGISGGIDSAIVSVIGLKAIKKLKSEGYDTGYDYVFLNCDSDPLDKEKAELLAKKFNFKLRYLDLTKWYEASPLLKSIPLEHPRAKIAQGNIKCRLRMISLYDSAQLNGYICLDTDDLSEEYMGFWTRHGDEGDVKIIQHLTKTELHDLGEYLNIPLAILNSQPGDGLKVSVKNIAEDQLGLPYIYIEFIISEMVRSGFNCNGNQVQLRDEKYIKEIEKISKKIDKPFGVIKKILEQSLKTAFKRKYGNTVKHLLPNRTEFGFIDFGTEEFAKKQLEAIKKYE